MILEQAVRAAVAKTGQNVTVLPDIQLDVPRHCDHGDFSTNIALKLARSLGMVPRDLAAAIVDNLQASPLIERAETAGPGFINLYVASGAFMDVIGQVLAAGEAYGHSDLGAGKRIQIEFVSANPTGPLHVGHGRGAAYGAVLANIFVATGHIVSREYYVNDAGRQMDILASSVLLRYLQCGGQTVVFPVNAYQGRYIVAMAHCLRAKFDKRFDCPSSALTSSYTDDADSEIALDELITRTKASLGPERYADIHRFARDEILAGIERDLRAFGVEFDNWFAESTLAESGSIDNAMTALAAGGHIYTKDGAQWFRSSTFGDEKDRVVIRENGAATYFASDIAYHADKYRRGFDHLINIWGADHHGYIARVKAAVAAAGFEPERLEILLVQFAVLFRQGKKISMSTRSGEFVTLAELIEEVGRDAARFFYITRRSDQHLDFDMDLAKSQSNDNPVYYVQYAHARICGVMTQLMQKGYAADTDAGLVSLNLLDDAKEKQLAVQLSRYRDIVESAVRKREPHLITTFLREIAADFHGYYHTTKIITDVAAQRNARLALILAVKQVLGNGLNLLGVSAPKSM